MAAMPSQATNSPPVTGRPVFACPQPGKRSERQTAPIGPTRWAVSDATTVAPVVTTAWHGDEEPPQRHAADEANVELAVRRVGVGCKPIVAAGGGAVAHLHHHHVPRRREPGRTHVETRRPKRSERAVHGNKVREEAGEAGHAVADADHRGAEAEPHAVHEPLAQYLPDVEASHLRGHEPLDRAHRAVAVDAGELREVVSRADRNDAERDIGFVPEQPVRHVVDRAVAAPGHDPSDAVTGSPYRAPQLAGSRPALRGRGTTVQC